VLNRFKLHFLNYYDETVEIAHDNRNFTLFNPGLQSFDLIVLGTISLITPVFPALQRRGSHHKSGNTSSGISTAVIGGGRDNGPLYPNESKSFEHLNCLAIKRGRPL